AHQGEAHHLHQSGVAAHFCGRLSETGGESDRSQVICGAETFRKQNRHHSQRHGYSRAFVPQHTHLPTLLCLPLFLLSLSPSLFPSLPPSLSPSLSFPLSLPLSFPLSLPPSLPLSLPSEGEQKCIRIQNAIKM